MNYKPCQIFKGEGMTRVLVVDDEEVIRFVFKKFLTDAGCEVAVAAHATDAKAILSNNEFDVAVVDRILPDGQGGIGLLKEIKMSQPSCEVIIMSGFPPPRSASETLEDDAFLYITKPVNMEEIVRVVEQAAERSKSKKKAP